MAGKGFSLCKVLQDVCFRYMPFLDRHRRPSRPVDEALLPRTNVIGVAGIGTISTLQGLITSAWTLSKGRLFFNHDAPCFITTGPEQVSRIHYCLPFNTCILIREAMDHTGDSLIAVQVSLTVNIESGFPSRSDQNDPLADSLSSLTPYEDDNEERRCEDDPGRAGLAEKGWFLLNYRPLKVLVL